MDTGIRFRERPVTTERSFYGDEQGKKPTNDTILGQLKTWNSSGQLLSTIDKRWSGSLKDSLSVERTWDEIHPGPPYKKGGPFHNIKVTYPAAKILGRGLYSDGNLKKYTGGFILALSTYGPQYNTLVDTCSTSMTGFPDVSGYHNKAWDLLRPKLEKAGAAQFLYELKDLPGMLKTSAKGFRDAYELLGGKEGRLIMQPKEAANHFLNHHFGWVPFVNDIIKFIDTYQRSREYIARISRDNGSWTRRRVVVDNVYSDTLLGRTYGPLTTPGPGELAMQSLYNSVQIDGISCFGFCDTRTIVKTEVWAEGSFKYYRPEFDLSLTNFDSELNHVKRLLILYGARINPDTLWKITPWSWLIDWFFALGRNISIANSWFEDSIMCKYAYIMHHQTESTIQRSISFFKSGSLCIEVPRKVEYKQRANAGSPYGFSTGWSQLSSKQLSILGAIGITRFNFG